ncbi:uracil-DNA glycosylase family protein [Galbibacter sp. EGI 63066]|uniref:uracil-DNA glycosylase family protein n=1 Tax=Galbibacter sp. EGI 63066 TaxID=2993559 RepID=UPI0022488C28|nr:uracil-DNA glycosylase family protein [Galbibacter sp. EGI 63066]MCX2679648.1 uracil-DNA glycosylase family protein [Galbibacter sp. EGI 63066]
MENLIKEIRNCTICEDYLPNEPRPILQASSSSKIIIIGQAPGQKVQNSGIPWDDASGNNLRKWLAVDKQQFYDEKLFALIPMGFCFPGTGKSGDLPPRKECAPKWHQQVFTHMKEAELIILIGLYAQKYYLANDAKRTLTETVKNYDSYLPKYLPLPHPSPRNNIWLRKNSWFETDVIPVLQERVSRLVK